MPSRNTDRRRPSLAALLLLCCAAFGACKTPPVWREVSHDAPFDEMWGTLTRIAERGGYPIDLSDSDRGRRVFVSKWRTLAAPFGLGSRTRLHGRFERHEDGTPGWLLRFHVERQAVRDIGVGFDPAEEDWEDGGQEPSMEQRILGQLRLAFGQKLGIEPTFEQNR